jgi:hypothetical protein
MRRRRFFESSAGDARSQGHAEKSAIADPRARARMHRDGPAFERPSAAMESVAEQVVRTSQCLIWLPV